MIKKPKIMVLVNTLNIGGAGRQAAILAHELKDSDYVVDLVQIAPSTLEIDNNHWQHADSCMALLPKIDYCTSRNIIYRLLSLWRLRNLIKKAKPDIVIALLPFPIFLSLIASLGLSIKVIGAERSYPPSRLKSERSIFGRFVLRSVYQLAARAVVLFVCQTQATKTWLLQLSDDLTVWQIPNALLLPLSEREPIVPPPPRMTHQRVRFISVGRLVTSKRMDMVIRAFARANSELADSELFVLGSGPEFEELASLIAELELQDKVNLVGNVGNVAAWYEDADVMVFASMFEGFPNVLLEAIGHGLATISFDIMVGPREITHDGRLGVLLPEMATESDLAKAMLQMASDGNLRHRYASRAFEVRDRYSPKNVKHAWIEAIESLYPS